MCARVRARVHSISKVKGEGGYRLCRSWPGGVWDDLKARKPLSLHAPWCCHGNGTLGWGDRGRAGSPSTMGHSGFLRAQGSFRMGFLAFVLLEDKTPVDGHIISPFLCAHWQFL